MPLFYGSMGATQKNRDAEQTIKKVIETNKTNLSDEDKVVIEAQYKNLKNNPNSSMIRHPYRRCSNRARVLFESKLALNKYQRRYGTNVAPVKFSLNILSENTAWL